MHTPATLTIRFQQINLNHVLTLLGCGYLIYYILMSHLHRDKSTSLRGPPAESYLFGLGRHINNSPDPDELYQCWAEEYGSVYRIPHMMGASTVMITDPKGIVHFYTRGAFGYMQTKLMRLLMDIMVNTLDELVNHGMRIINIHRLDKGYCLLEARHTEYSEKPSPQHSATQPSKKSPLSSSTPHMRSHPVFYLHFKCAYSNMY